MRFSKQLLFIAVPLILLSGCGNQPAAQAPPVKTDTAAVAASGPLFDALRQDTDKYLKSRRPLTITAQEVFDKAVTAADASYYLVDVRADEHYAAHQIPGSVHISYADAWRSSKTDFLPKDKKIVVIDYSGHSSSQIAALWSMMGLDAVAMKHGMAGWSKDKDVIGGSPIPCEPKNFAVTKDVPVNALYDFPVFDTKAVTPQNLLRLRAEAVVAKPVVIQADDLLAKATAKSVTVLDVRAPEHFNAGHIAGAINIPFNVLAEEGNLKKIPANKPLVVVCYDGHASSQAARVLNQLGYDAVALRDGMSIWTGNVNVIGASAVSCTIAERITAKLNAPLQLGPSTAAT